MVKQYEDGYFINGVWHSGKYIESTVNVFEKHTQPINIPTCNCHECKCGDIVSYEPDDVEMYKARMILGVVCIAIIAIIGMFIFL